MKKKLAGYRNKVSVRAGERISFFVHVADGDKYDADLIRVLHGGTDDGSPGLVFESLEAEFAGTHVGRAQPISCGSFGLIEPSSNDLEIATSFSFGCAVYPTYFNKGRATDKPQIIASGFGGGALAISPKGHLVLYSGETLAIELDERLPTDRWSFVGVTYDHPSNSAHIFQSPIPANALDLTSTNFVSSKGKVNLKGFRADEIAFAARVSEDDLGHHRPSDCFNGRLEAPRLRSCATDSATICSLILSERPNLTDRDLQGFWDFSREISSRELVDLSRNKLSGKIENLPTRAVAGFRWTGDERDWRKSPREYGAIHFHEDDVYDMKWEESFSWIVPANFRSGLYAVRLVSGGETEYISFFVVPKHNSKRAPVALIASTATYLSYANERARYLVDQYLGGGEMAVSPEMQMLLDTPEFGASQYETHKDKSGIHYSSYLRPLLNWRPDSTMWALNADTALIHWLEQGGWDYDVITDHDLHCDGAALLHHYGTVITGTHPEYLSTEMFDAYESYLSGGGRLMYMGGNGFYWRVAFSDVWPGAMEVRRAEGGTRAWFAKPGEYHQSFNGEYGGLWRNQGRTPNSLVGIGFAAQGFSTSTYYRKAPGAESPRASFVFEGVDEDVIGDFGLRGGGAAGEEIDRFDRSLGSPPHTLILASSENLPPDMLRVVEEFTASMPHGKDPAVRADMTFFETPTGGAVFSTGSIAWSGSLCHNAYDNNVAKITENVLKRFLDSTPFSLPI